MTITTRKKSAALAVAGVVGLTAAVGATAYADDESARLTPVDTANAPAPGLTSPNRLSPELIQTVRAQGSNVVENPRDGIGYYGYVSVDNNPPLLPVAGGSSPTEAQKSEPDKNTYLVLRRQTGPDASYNYGSHFLFQGHEAGSPGSVTRVNLDADADHRVTLLATRDDKGNPLPTFDGSTWDPFARKLLMTAEAGCKGGVWAGDATYRPDGTFNEVPALGKGGYEGIQTASDGSIWMVEDVGGSSPSGTNAKLPASFVYRFVPETKGDLTTGTLQALQVLRPSGEPMQTGTDLLSADIKALHKLGSSFRTRWVDVHTTTAANRDETFCATTAAKSAGATAFKRPENGVFRPGSRFGEFFFTETGDTNVDSTANADAGGYGGIFRLKQASPSARMGRLNIFALGDREHTGFDNLAFATDRHLLVVEDAGDSLHKQRGALDSGFMFDVSKPYTDEVPLRWLAEGRDPSATLDSSMSEARTPGFTNDGDNEITGIHVSDGNPTPAGLLGARVPTPFKSGWRVFWTQQHGDNTTFEVLPAGRS